MKKIACIHLFNDFSGSPLVLSTVIKGFLQKGHAVDVITCTKEEGFLSNLEVNYVNIDYCFVANKWMRLFVFLFNQWRLFYTIIQLYRNDKNTTLYINTLLPFGAAIAGKILGLEVIYHIHETSVKPATLKNFLKWMANNTAQKAIYVSKFLLQKEPLEKVDCSVIYNALGEDFIQKANRFKYLNTKEDRIILMLCSLKDYKGVKEFVALAYRLPQLRFELVLNTTPIELEMYFKTIELPENLTLFSKQNNVHPFYQRAWLVLNLSHPEQWVETFGMTLLEAMHYGIPTIAPPVGGPAEIVENDYNGYCIDQRELDLIVHQIEQMFQDEQLYQRLSVNAETKAAHFKVRYMKQAVNQVLAS